jgi:replicative superfamily II helicase
LAIVRLLQKQKTTQRTSEEELAKKLTVKQKIIYLAPIKALCQERLNDWKTKFAPLGIKCTSVGIELNNFAFSDTYSLLSFLLCRC